MRKSDETRARLRAAALHLFMAKGVSETTTREIAAAAGIAEGTIYRHYPSKESLAHDLMREIAERMGAAVEKAIDAEESTRGKLAAAVHSLCREADEDWTGFAYYLLHGETILPGLDPAVVASPDTAFRATLSRGMDDGELPRRDLDLVSALIRGLVHQTGRARLTGGLGGSMTGHADEIAAAAWRVAGEKDKQPEKSFLRSLFGSPKE